MSIPTPFNPLGTLGANPLAGYVTDGLILWFDALEEKPGRRTYLTNLVTGTRCDFTSNILIKDGTIAYAKDAYTADTSFHSLTEPLEGHAAYGEEYSADLCAEDAEAGTSTKAAVLGHPWGNTGDKSSRIPAFQLKGRELIVNTSNTTRDPCWVYGVAGRFSAHMEFLAGSYIRVNGGTVGAAGMYKAAVAGSYVLGLPGDGKLCAYRLYNRRLTVAEQMKNYEMDKKRFNLS